MSGEINGTMVLTAQPTPEALLFPLFVHVRENYGAAEHAFYKKVKSCFLFVLLFVSSLSVLSDCVGSVAPRA
jgi:hypothetical protein